MICVRESKECLKITKCQKEKVIIQENIDKIKFLLTMNLIY